MARIKYGCTWEEAASLGHFNPSQRRGRPANQRSDITAYIWSLCVSVCVCVKRLRLVLYAHPLVRRQVARTRQARVLFTDERRNPGGEGTLTFLLSYVDRWNEASPPRCAFSYKDPTDPEAAAAAAAATALLCKCTTESLSIVEKKISFTAKLINQITIRVVV